MFVSFLAGPAMCTVSPLGSVDKYVSQETVGPAILLRSNAIRLGKKGGVGGWSPPSAPSGAA
jgi:hypothetical protein